MLGFPIPTLTEDYHASVVAAALFGEGMSSPLLDQIRERRGLVYYAACSADVSDLCGQFVVEASTSHQHLDEFVVEATRLLGAHAEAIDPVDLERARNQIAVRTLRALERPSRRLEDAALDLYVHGRIRSRAELMERVEAVTRGRRARSLRADADRSALGRDRRRRAQGRCRPGRRAHRPQAPGLGCSLTPGPGRTDALTRVRSSRPGRCRPSGAPRAPGGQRVRPASRPRRHAECAQPGDDLGRAERFLGRTAQPSIAAPGVPAGAASAFQLATL